MGEMKEGIVVTGGKGFIGKHLVKELKKQNFNVFTFDIKNGEEQDVRNFESFLNFCKKVRPKHIVHLAALCIDEESVKKPLEYFETNVRGTYNVFEVGRRVGVERIVFSSSAGVEGKTPYGISKRIGELLADLYVKTYGMNIFTLRIFNVYGEGNDKGVIKEFFDRVKEGKPLLVHGDGEYVRDYIHVHDVCRVIVDFLEKDHEPGIYEVGTGKGTSVNELVDIISKVTGLDLKRVYVPDRHRRIKISVAKRPFVKDFIPLEIGIKMLWESVSFS